MVAKTAKIAKKKIVLVEGDKHFNRINNYLIADEGSLVTPELVLESEINEIIEKIKVLTGSSMVIKNNVINIIIKEKIEAYKDCSESLVKISQLMNRYTQSGE